MNFLFKNFLASIGIFWATALLPQTAVAQTSFPEPDASVWTACLKALRPQAVRAGISASTWAAAFKDVTPDGSVLAKLDNQPEFKTPIWDYMAGLVDNERVADGKRMLEAHLPTLERVAQSYGVDPATVVAVWGVESNFGQSFGRYPLVQALGTLSCFGRRQAFFQGELLATLRIQQRGDVAPERLVGSWAGAFGHTQFMPTTYERLAVDFDGDGRRDLTASVADALASTAHFLQKAGWKAGLTWGVEVKLPAGFSLEGEGRRSKRPASAWDERGIKPVAGGSATAVFGADTQLGLMTLAGASGPAFLVSRNFDAIYGYNAAESYGLAIAHLSDRLRGSAPFSTPWPTDDPGLSRAQRRDLQTLLSLRGHDIGTIDGMLGDKSRVAIKAEQTRLGYEASGRGGQKLLKALQPQ